MPRACTVCTHGQSARVDEALLNGQSLRNIAKQFGPSLGALTRHKNGCLPRLLAAHAEPAHVSKLRAEVEQRKLGEQSHALDVLAELTRQIERVNLLSDAVDQWLRDPEDITRYHIGPRSTDISVVYMDHRGEKPRRAKDSLAELLERVERGGYTVLSAESRYADPRELLLKAADGLKGQITLIASILEKLSSAQEVETFRAIVLEAIGEVDPNVRDAIADRLSQRLALRAHAGHTR